MRNVLTPISTSVVTSIALRPTRSPKWPKMAAPTGPAAKPTNWVPNEGRMPVQRFADHREDGLPGRPHGAPGPRRAAGRMGHLHHEVALQRPLRLADQVLLVTRTQRKPCVVTDLGRPVRDGGRRPRCQPA